MRVDRAILMAILLTGCTPSSEDATEGDTQQELPPHAVVGTADLSEGVQEWADSLLSEIGHESAKRNRRLNGEIFPMTEDRNRKRALLMGLGTPYGEEDEIVLVLFDDSLNQQTSEPWSTKIVYDEYNFEELATLDADEDGQLDFAYCSWTDEDPQGEVTILGHTTSWYEVESDDGLNCGPQGSP